MARPKKSSVETEIQSDKKKVIGMCYNGYSYKSQDFTNIIFEDCDFEGSDFQGCQFEGSEFINCNIGNADMRWASGLPEGI